jgi:hypothetical protein
MSTFSKILVLCALASVGCVSEATEADTEATETSSDELVRSDLLPGVGAQVGNSTGMSDPIAPSTWSVQGRAVSGREGEDHGGPPPVPWRTK